jgi:hypothetical protein
MSPGEHGFLASAETPAPALEPEQVAIGENGDGPAPDAGPAADAAPAADEAAPGPAPEPAEGPAPGPATPCAITNRSTVHAPDGTADTRRKIGVCETIRFTVGGQAANWSVNDGWPRARNGRSVFDWAAPEQPGTYSINATVPATGRTCSLDMTVVAPASLRMRRQNVMAFAAGSAGAGMRLLVRVFPRDVNFGWVSLLEDPGPASGVTGYFLARQTAGADLRHHPNLNFVRFGWNNTICCDTAALLSAGAPAPWAAGRFFWRIPNRYRCANSTGTGHVFTHTFQRFAIDAAGRVTITKPGASVARSP